MGLLKRSKIWAALNLRWGSIMEFCDRLTDPLDEVYGAIVYVECDGKMIISN
jgi:hypothetical protein